MKLPLPHQRRGHRAAVDAAVAYLTARNAIHKLRKPVTVLFSCPHHRRIVLESRAATSNLRKA